jgi:obg-like ATPase 1
MGIVGLPNVGKSSFFNVLCSQQVDAANFPFCTIDPNVSRVPVPDERFDWLVEKYKPKSVVPAVLTITDIAGLVKGAAEGQGLGNAFLSHIQAVDGIFHVCRAFSNEDIIHVEGACATAEATAPPLPLRGGVSAAATRPLLLPAACPPTDEHLHLRLD